MVPLTGFRRSVVRRVAGLALLLALCGGSTGCTLVKPMVGAVTGPIYAVGATGVPVGCGCRDGCGVALYFLGAAAVGAVAGLVTGVISDVRVLTGHAREPVENWWNPFDTN